MIAREKWRLGIVFLMIFVVTPASCLPNFRAEQEKVSACAEEQVTLLKPGWEASWSARVEDEYVSDPPFVAGKHLIVLGRTIGSRSRPRMRAYQIDSGEEVWKVSNVNVGAISLQTLALTRDFIATYAPHSATVLRVETGEPVLELDNLWVFSLALGEQRLYIHDYSGNIRAYDLPSEQLVWERQLPEATRNSYLFVTQERLVVDLFEELWILNADSGQTIDQFPSSYAASWLLEDAFLVGESGIGLAYLHVISLKTGKLLWREEHWPFMTYEPPGYSNRILYLPSDLGEEGAELIRAVEVENGSQVWSYKPEGGLGVISGIAVSNGTGYAIFSDGTLRAIDLKTGKVSIVLKSDTLYHWGVDDAERFSVPGIAVSDNHLFVSFGCQTVYALRMPERGVE